MMKMDFQAKVAPGPYAHFGIGPVNWSEIVAVETSDASRADSVEMDNRNEAVLILHYADRPSECVSFGRDYELRDKVWDVVVAHQTRVAVHKSTICDKLRKLMLALCLRVRRLLAGEKPADVADALDIGKSTLYQAINGVLAPRLMHDTGK